MKIFYWVSTIIIILSIMTFFYYDSKEFNKLVSKIIKGNNDNK